MGIARLCGLAFMVACACGGRTPLLESSCASDTASVCPGRCGPVQACGVTVDCGACTPSPGPTTSPAPTTMPTTTPPPTPKGPSKVVLVESDGKTAAGLQAWQFDGVAWTRQSDPTGLMHYAGASLHGQAAFFGDHAPPESNLITAFDGSSWSMGTTDVMPLRGFPCLASFGNGLVLFGGIHTNQPPTLTILGDTWVFDGVNWSPSSATGPSPRENAAMAALGSDRVVLYGGSGTPPLDDTWIFDGATWTQVDGPGPGPRAGFGFATMGSRVVLFGGGDGDPTRAGFKNDTWLFDGTRWSQVPVAGPSGRVLPAMAARGDGVVLFGGLDANATLPGDTWTFDGTTWKEVTTPVAPPAMDSARAVMASQD